MKLAHISLVAGGLVAAFCAFQSTAALAAGATEYAVIQWWGNNENTQVLWPDGRVDHLDHLIPDLKVPDHAHERAYIMTQLMNKLAKDGYEYAGMASGEELVMRRAK